MQVLTVIGVVVGIVGGILGVVAFVRGEIRSSREHGWRAEEVARRRWEAETLAWSEQIRDQLISDNLCTYEIETPGDLERARFLVEKGRAKLVRLGDGSGDALVFEDLARQLTNDPCPTDRKWR